jgi:hypothetical protein
MINDKINLSDLDLFCEHTDNIIESVHVNGGHGAYWIILAKTLLIIMIPRVSDMLLWTIFGTDPFMFRHVGQGMQGIDTCRWLCAGVNNLDLG